MKSFHGWRLVLLHVLVVVSLVSVTISPLAGAQSGPGATSPHDTVAGVTLAWDDPWVVEETLSERTGVRDVVFLTDGSATLVVATGDWTFADARDAAFTALGGDPAAATGLDEGATYWFGVVPLDGGVAGTFGLATSSPDGVSAVDVMFFAPVAGFATGLGFAQAGITLDGEPVLDGVDGAALQAQLEANVPAVETPLPPFEPIDSWTDDAFGYTVEWADGWDVMGTRDTNTIVLAPTGSTIATVNMTAMPVEGMTPQAWADRFEENFPKLVQDVVVLDPVVGSDNTVVAGLFDGGAIIEEVLFLDDGETVVLVTFGLTDVDHLAAITGNYRASVRIDGRAPLDGWEAIAPQLPQPAAEAVPTPTSAPPATTGNVRYADAGMVSDTSYVSPQFGTQVQWTDEWRLDPASAVPVMTDPANSTDFVTIAWFGNEWGRLAVYSLPAWGVPGIQQLIDAEISQGFIATQYGDDAVILMSDGTATHGAILIRVPGMAGAYVYEEYRLSADGSSITVAQLIIMAGDGLLGFLDTDLDRTLVAAQEGVTVNGEPVLTYYPVDTVLEAFGE